MGKEGCNLSLGVINGTDLTELRVRLDSLQKHLPRVEVLPGAPRVRLVDYSIEELLRHDVRHRHVVRAWCQRRCVALALLAPRAAVVVAFAAVSVLAAALVRRAPTVLCH